LLGKKGYVVVVVVVVPPDYTKENNQTDIKLHRRFSEIIHQNNS